MIEIFRAINDLNPIFMKKKFKLAKRASSNKYKLYIYYYTAVYRQRIPGTWMCKEINVVTKVLICKSLNHKTVPSCLIVKEGGGGGGGGEWRF